MKKYLFLNDDLKKGIIKKVDEVFLKKTGEKNFFRVLITILLGLLN